MISLLISTCHGSKFHYFTIIVFFLRPLHIHVQGPSFCSWTCRINILSIWESYQPIFHSIIFSQFCLLPWPYHCASIAACLPYLFKWILHAPFVALFLLTNNCLLPVRPSSLASLIPSVVPQLSITFPFLPCLWSSPLQNHFLYFHCTLFLKIPHLFIQQSPIPESQSCPSWHCFTTPFSFLLMLPSSLIHSCLLLTDPEASPVYLQYQQHRLHILWFFCSLECLYLSTSLYRQSLPIMEWSNDTLGFCAILLRKTKPL